MLTANKSLFFVDVCTLFFIFDRILLVYCAKELLIYEVEVVNLYDYS